MTRQDDKMVATLNYFRFCLVLFWIGISSVTIAKYETNKLYNLFEIFANRYERDYVTNATEYERRFKIFKDNLEKADRLNKDHVDISEPVYGITKFSDLSPSEFKDLYLSSNMPKYNMNESGSHPNSLLFTSEKLGIPEKVDWRSMLTPIKNQKTCGACWAFSTVENMEAMYAIQYNKSKERFSVQQMIDCDVTSNGCDGGDICKAASWASSNGIVQESHYPLTDETDKCKTVSKSFPRIQVKDHECEQHIGEEHKTLAALVHGPVAVAVDGTSWHSYVKGIIRFHCSNVINHAVSIVGYDLTGEVPYYIVRNSWGADFGDNGFLYIKVGDNLCGIATEVSSFAVSVTDMV